MFFVTGFISRCQKAPKRCTCKYKTRFQTLFPDLCCVILAKAEVTSLYNQSILPRLTKYLINF